MVEEQAGDLYLTELYSDLQRNWFKTNEPYKYITCKTPEDIEIRVDQPLTQMYTRECEWDFTINIAKNSNKQLWKVILLPDCKPNVFQLQSVRTKIKKNIKKRIGRMSKLEWYVINSKILYQQAKQYSVKIKCEMEKVGVYRTNVLFNFGDFPAVLRRLCVDYAIDPNIGWFRTQRFQQLELISNRWLDPYIFPTADEYDNRELNMSNIYPFPDENNFYLTHDTDLVTTATKENYRGHLHELINLEEIAMNDILLRFSGNNMKMLIKTPLEINIESGCRINVTQFELFAKVPLNRKLDDGKNCHFFVKECHHALIKRKEYDILKVPIVGRSATSAYFGLHKDCVERWQLKKYNRITVDVQFVMNRLKFCNWHWAVDSLEYIHGEAFYGTSILRDSVDRDNILHRLIPDKDILVIYKKRIQRVLYGKSIGCLIIPVPPHNLH